MSYSFQIRQPSKALAIGAVSARLAEIVLQQEPHKADCTQAMAAAEAFINVLPDDDTCDVVVTMNGSVSWQGSWASGSARICSAAVGVSAALAVRMPPT